MEVQGTKSRNNETPKPPNCNSLTSRSEPEASNIDNIPFNYSFDKDGCICNY